MITQANEIIFVYSPQPAIDRGWKPQDAKEVAEHEFGFRTVDAHVDSVEALLEVLLATSSPLVWPVCYTLEPQVDGTLLTAVLEDLGVPYVGATQRNVLFSSKLVFKRHLRDKTPYSTPDYQVLDSTTDHLALGYPAVMKTEYTCNSEGVAVVYTPHSLSTVAQALRERFHQRVFAERWEREREFTVAYLPSYANVHATAAAMEMRVIGAKRYIDSEAKGNNRLLAFERPGPVLASQLEDMTCDIARLLDIDGHFRLDFVMNSQGDLFAIDANFLPYLTRRPPQQSYFPLAFELARKLSYRSIIRRILLHAVDRSDALRANELLTGAAK